MSLFHPQKWLKAKKKYLYLRFKKKLSFNLNCSLSIITCNSGKRATAKSALTSFSLWPRYLEVKLEADMLKNVAELSLATARAKK